MDGNEEVAFQTGGVVTSHEAAPTPGPGASRQHAGKREAETLRMPQQVRAGRDRPAQAQGRWSSISEKKKNKESDLMAPRAPDKPQTE